MSGGQALKNMMPDSFIWNYNKNIIMWTTKFVRISLILKLDLLQCNRGVKCANVQMCSLTNVTVPTKKTADAARIKLYFFCLAALLSVQSPSGWGSWLKLAGGAISSTGGPYDEKRCTGATVAKIKWIQIDSSEYSDGMRSGPLGPCYYVMFLYCVYWLDFRQKIFDCEWMWGGFCPL